MNHKRGRLYEQAAIDYLKSKGYRIIETNYRYGRHEIDIICTFNDELIFVEVKGGSSFAFGDPVYRVDQRKQRAIIEVAQGYLIQSTKSYTSYRFDVVVVKDRKLKREFEHFENAFTL